MVREAAERPITIMKRDKVVGYLLSPQRMEMILETLEIMANPKAMEAIRKFERGEGKYYPLSILDEDEAGS
jgi:PHD/YefM family antitoxin component YafN of YafNO toxin-antitoxin module